jgi:hypothetical protein
MPKPPTMAAGATFSDSKALPPAPRLLKQQQHASAQDLPSQDISAPQMVESIHRGVEVGTSAAKSDLANLDHLHEELMKEYEKTMLQHSRADVSSSSASTPSTVVATSASGSLRSHTARDQLPVDADSVVDCGQRMPGKLPSYSASSSSAEDARQSTSSFQDLNAAR